MSFYDGTAMAAHALEKYPTMSGLVFHRANFICRMCETRHRLSGGLSHEALVTHIVAEMTARGQLPEEIREAVLETIEIGVDRDTNFARCARLAFEEWAPIPATPPVPAPLAPGLGNTATT